MSSPSKRAKKTATTPSKRAAVQTRRNKPLKSVTPCVVGIGVSAGGFEALRNFFQVMPSDSGLAFVVIQHLDPTRECMASDVVSKWTTMSVLEAKQGLAVEPNHIYTIPANKYLSVHKGKLCLSMPHQHRTLHLPIDYFFDSLGVDQRQRAVGIILSGTGSDGSLGVKSIEINGGITLVQDPDTATLSGMPRSALATGAVKLALPVESMPALLMKYVQHTYVDGVAVALEKEAGSTTALDGILDLICAQFRFSFSGYKHSTLLRRIHRRMSLHQVTTLVSYATVLKQQSQELDALFNDMFTNITDFFRDPPAWKILASEVIAPMVRAKRDGEPIRVWVPSCSTGEEGYTVAMLVLDALAQNKKQCPVLIFATDINDEALRIARLGIYPAGIAAQIQKDYLQQFFTADSHQFYVNQKLRAALVFDRHNLITDPPFSQLDLIICRSILFDLEPEIQKKMLRLFDFALRPSGYLFLDSAESPGELSQRFNALSKKWCIFQQVSVTPARIMNLPVIPKSKDSLEEVISINEGLQSQNEALSTFNQQLQTKVLELEKANNDLKNLLLSSDIATLCLDRKLRIKWFTPGMESLFKLIPGDIGRPIGDFPESLYGNGLIKDCKTLLKNQLPVYKEVQLPNSRWYLRRQLPYRAEREDIIGVTVTFTDITDSKLDAEAIIESQKATTQTLEKMVHERTKQLRTLSVELALTEENERRSLARDLHDDLGQLLSVAKIKLAVLEKVNKTSELRMPIKEINTILDNAHTSIYSLTSQLSPPLLDELGLLAALEWLAEEIERQYGLRVIIDDDGKPKAMALQSKSILFRVVRELLINVAKHAKVSTASVTTALVGNKIKIVIRDDGVGFHPHRKLKRTRGRVGGFGLLSVRERINYMGGEIRTESIPGEGTCITLLVPTMLKTRKKAKKRKSR